MPLGNNSLKAKEQEMDPITLAIIGALSKLGENVIHDAYNALKAALQHKFGVDSELVESVEKLEQKPNSKARQAVLQEEVKTSKADQDPELVKVAKVLQEKLNAVTSGGGETINITQTAGDNATQIGTVKGDITFGQD